MSSSRVATNGTAQLFSGLCICTTGLALHVKEQIRKIVLACDGAFEDDLTLDATTHLIADAVGSHKHRAAAAKHLTILSTRWIFDSFRAHERLDPVPYRLRALEGLVICTTGLSEQTRVQVEKLSAVHGGIYDPNLEVGRTDVLIAQVPNGAKYDAAVAHGIPVVHISWLHACTEKGCIVDEALYSLHIVLRPRQIYKQLRQELDDLSGHRLRQLIQRFWTQERGDDAIDEDEDECMDLFDACGFYLLGFPPEMEKSLQHFIRAGMGTIYYEMQVPAVSHVVVSPVLPEIDRLDQLEQYVASRDADASVHFVSAKWVVDSIKCLRLEPEEMYPVEIEEPLDEASIVPAVPMPLDTSGTGEDVSMDLLPDEDDGPDGEQENEGGTKSSGAIFQGFGFVVVCLDPEEPHLVRGLVQEIQKRGGALAVALDARDFEHLDPAQFDFVTHVVIGSGVSLDPELVQLQKDKFFAFAQQQSQTQKPKRLRLVSDLWVRCCLAAECVLSHASHELFSLTYHQPRSMFPIALPLPCFKKVVASTSVYVGVDRLVVMELLKMAGAQVTSKLSKKNTHLICLNPIGMKYDKAVQWKLAVVTARWVVQSVLQGELLDTKLTDFQVVDDDGTQAESSSTGSRTTLGSSGSRTTLGSFGRTKTQLDDVDIQT